MTIVKNHPPEQSAAMRSLEKFIARFENIYEETLDGFSDDLCREQESFMDIYKFTGVTKSTKSYGAGTKNVHAR